MKIKICGIRRKEDVDYVNQYKPDYIGFIFWEKSFRYVTGQQAGELRRLLDAQIPAAGVFVDADREKIAELVRGQVIQIIQLHGQESEEEIAAIRRLCPGVPIWKAFKIRSEEDLLLAVQSSADEILLDNGCGTGEAFDHKLLSGFQRRFILAGGLTPETIVKAALLQPETVDISSGVETDRKKDKEKIRRAILAAHSL